MKDIKTLYFKIKGIFISRESRGLPVMHVKEKFSLQVSPFEKGGLRGILRITYLKNLP